MNTIVPQAWIIQEKKRRDEEKRRRESENSSVPISLPNDSDIEDEYFEHSKAKPEAAPNTRVIIIDI